MPKWEMFKESLKKRASNDADYKDCIKDLLTNQEVRDCTILSNMVMFR